MMPDSAKYYFLECSTINDGRVSLNTAVVADAFANFPYPVLTTTDTINDASG